MAFATSLSYFVQDTGTGLGVAGLTASGSFTTFKVSEDGTPQSDIKSTVSIIDEGGGNYTFAYTTIGTPVKSLKAVPIMATATYQAYPVIVGADSLRQLAGTAVATVLTGDAFARLGAPAGASVSADIAANAATLSAGVKVSVGSGAGQINVSSGKVPATIAAGDATDPAAVLAVVKAGGTGDNAAILAQTNKMQFDVSNNVKAVKNATDAAGVDFSAVEKQSITDSVLSNPTGKTITLYDKPAGLTAQETTDAVNNLKAAGRAKDLYSQAGGGGSGGGGGTIIN